MEFDCRDIPLEVGIHYDMPMEDYLSIKACSRSTIRDLMISPLTAWARSPFNPDLKRKDTPARALGTAYHTRLLEGRAAFESRYAPAFDKSRVPDIFLQGGDALRKKCKELGITASGTLAEMSERIRARESAIGADLTPLAHFCEIQHLKKFAGREFIPGDEFHRIEASASALESNPEIAEMLKAGKPEVTLLWRDENFGVPMKARCDLLDLEKTFTWLEFKTFSNSRGKELKRAVADAMAEHKYGLQAITSMKGLQALKQPQVRALFLFQETGEVPNVVARQFKRTGLDSSENLYWATARSQYNIGVQLFAEYYAQFGESPWRTSLELEAFEDEDFPAWSK